MPITLAGVIICASYLIGSIPFGLLTGLIVGKIDVRTAGSGNIGATNVGRLLGKKWGFVVFLLDFAKGLLPVIILSKLYIHYAQPTAMIANTVLVLAGMGTILGHTFPLYLKFKGGKGVATSAGVLAAINWPVIVTAFVLWALIALISHYISLASIIAASALPILYGAYQHKVVFGEGIPIFIFCLLIALLVIFRHRTNISRLLKGTENKVLQKKKASEEEAQC